MSSTVIGPTPVIVNFLTQFLVLISDILQPFPLLLCFDSDVVVEEWFYYICELLRGL